MRRTSDHNQITHATLPAVRRFCPTPRQPDPTPALSTIPAISVLMHCPAAAPLPDTEQPRIEQPPSEQPPSGAGSSCRWGLAGAVASLLRAGEGIAWELVAVIEEREPLLETLADQLPKGQVQVLTADRDESGKVTPAMARNQAMAHCRAPVLAVLDAGQRCRPKRLTLPLQLLDQHADLDLAWGGWSVGSVSHQPWLDLAGFEAAYLLRAPQLLAGGLTVRRSCAEHYGGFCSKLPAWSGVDLALRLVDGGGVAAWIGQPLLQCRPAPHQQPWPVNAMADGLLELLRIHSEGIRPEQLVELRFAAMAWCAALAWLQRQPDEAHRCWQRATLGAPLPAPRAAMQSLQQFNRSMHWCGHDQEPTELLNSQSWQTFQTLGR